MMQSGGDAGGPRTPYYKMLGFQRLDQFAQTPPHIYNLLDQEFNFDFDPCPVKPKFNGLEIEWGKSNYVNPPYEDIRPWLEKAVEELERGNTSVFLIPFRPWRKYFVELIFPNASEIRFFRHKFGFLGYDAVAPFAVYVVVFSPKRQRKTYKFTVFDFKTASGGQTIDDLLNYYKQQYAFDFIKTDGKADLYKKRWGKINFVSSTVQTPQLIDRAVELAALGVTTVLVVCMRAERSYFLSKIMFGKAKKVIALSPCVIFKGYDEASPTGSVLLIFGPGGTGRFVGPRLSIIEN